MSISEVGSGQVSVVPVFKGFRKEVTKETSGAVSAASSLFGAGFKKAGQDSGKGFASGFSANATGAGATVLKQLTSDVAKSAREVSAARLKEQDATGKVRLAEAQLTEARNKGVAGSSQVVRAEERLASAQRTQMSVKSTVISATDKLTSAQKKLTAATEEASRAADNSGGFFSRLPPIFGSVGRESAAAFGSSFNSGVGQIFTGSFLANIATSALRQGGQALGDAALAGLHYSLQGVSLASELEQSTGAIEAVFKDQADAVIGYSKASATAVGLSRSAYQKYATVVGAQLKNLGLPIAQVSGKTNDLIVLGADLAAQFGGPTSDAVAALSSLLRGERDPIERYGVGLKQADIDARKAAMGLDKLTGEADKQADIQATLALLWEQTADAQGTFFRETDTYAHKQQVLNAQLEEAQTRLGEALIPAFSEFATFAADELIPTLDGVIDRLGPKLGDAMKRLGPQVEDSIDDIVPHLERLIEFGADEGLPFFLDQLEKELGPAGIIGGFPKFQQEWNGFWNSWDQGFIGRGVEAVTKWNEESKAVLADFFNTLDGGAFTTGLETFWDGLMTWGEDVNQPLWDWDTLFNPEAAETAAQAAVEGARVGGQGMRQAGIDTATGFGDGIAANQGYAEDAAKQMAENVVGTLRGTLRIQSPSRVMRELGSQTVEGYVLGIKDGRAETAAAIQSLISLDGSAASSSSPSMVGVDFAKVVSAMPVSGVTPTQVIVYPSEGMDEAVLAQKVAYKVDALAEAVT